MKLRNYAEQKGLTYTTAYRHYHKGEIPGAYQLDSGTIIVPDDRVEIIIRGTPDQIQQVQNFCCSGSMFMTTGCMNILELKDGRDVI